MNGLRIRIAILAALVALLATSVSALVGVRSARQGAREQQARIATRGIEDVRDHIRQMLVDLGGETEDYAWWDELYAQMPRPTNEWSSINLQPGRSGSGLTQVYALVVGENLIGRYRFGRPPQLTPDTADPAAPWEIVALARRRAQGGIAILSGRPALWASRPILRSDRKGPEVGTLVALSYLSADLISRIQVRGMTLSYEPSNGVQEEDIQVGFIYGRVWASTVEPAVGGGLKFTVQEQGNESEVIALRTNQAIVLAGVITAVLATLAGVALGWHWVRPINDLAAACRRRAADPRHPLPRHLGLSEAQVLAAALVDLVESERQQRDELAATLARETTSNAVHQRFLGQLGQEFGTPIRQLIHVVDRLAAQDGHLAPDEVAAARQLAETLEERFHEVLGLAAESTSEVGGSERDLADYAASLRELLRPVAARKGVELVVEAPAERALVDGRLLTPVLVNLTVNAITAAAGRRVTVRVVLASDGGMSWTIADTGPGMDPVLAGAITEACVRNEVLPGTPGIGLGLVLALANVRALAGRLSLDRSGPDGTVFTVHLPPLRAGSDIIRAR